MRIISLPILVALTSLACPAATDSTADSKAAGATADAKGPVDTNTPTDAKAPETKTPDAKSPDTKPSDPAIADKRAKAKAKIAGADDAELAKRRAQMLEALNQGRKLVKDGDVAGGMAKYEALLAIAPNYGPALGELGWAEFKAGKLDDAHAHTLRALAEASEPNKRGMLLYNLGRIAEARGQSQAAIDHYQASLVARPNDVVAKQLADLQATVAASPTPPPPVEAPPTVPGTPGPGLALIGKDLANLDALCELSRRDSMCGDEGSSCELVATPDGGAGHGVLHIDAMGMIRCWQPVVSTPTGSLLFELSMLGQHGSEVEQDIDTISSRIESNDAGKFLIIEFSDHVYERAWMDLETEEELPAWVSDDREAMIICRIDAEPACTSAITTRHDHVGEEGSGEAASYSARVALRGAMIVVGEVVTSGAITPALGGGSLDGGYQMLPAGEYAFADLARR